ncbi:MAG TPA: glycosyltransferase [Myxococcales bacterium]|jgi:dolichol-phosphate mannosyltransferase|nr:glycosyltransferase [Myxococcales bacterium]
MPALIVLPSYNERQNIIGLIDALLALGPALCVCVVDDSSPDGTGDLVREAAGERSNWSGRVHLISRSCKDGRGGAVREGLAWGRAQGRFDAYVEMDCDFSHAPGAVPEGLALLSAGNAVVLGVRYPGGTIVGWPLGRRTFSFLANTLARVLIDPSIADYTNGFRFYSPAAIDLLLSRQQRHKGYIYLSETLSLFLREGLRLAAFPIRFQNRERGVSNTSIREVGAAMRGILSIAWSHRFGGP